MRDIVKIDLKELFKRFVGLGLLLGRSIDYISCKYFTSVDKLLQLPSYTESRQLFFILFKFVTSEILSTKYSYDLPALLAIEIWGGRK